MAHVRGPAQHPEAAVPVWHQRITLRSFFNPSIFPSLRERVLERPKLHDHPVSYDELAFGGGGGGGDSGAQAQAAPVSGGTGATAAVATHPPIPEKPAYGDDVANRTVRGGGREAW